MKVEVDVLGSPSLMSAYGFSGRKAAPQPTGSGGESGSASSARTVGTRQELIRNCLLCLIPFDGEMLELLTVGFK